MPAALPSSWNDMTIAVIADLHAGAPYIDEAKIQAIVAMTNTAKPDLILIPGDFFNHVLGGRVMPTGDIARLLSPLRAPMGVYAVLGNHDWWEDYRAMEEALERYGITVIENKKHMLANGIELVGLSDYDAGVFDPNIIPRDTKALCMTHTPDAFPHLSSSCALTIAGHTHGGQVKLPFLPPLWTPSAYGARYAAGYSQESGRALFVSTGIGTSVLPIRFGVPPEVSLLTLRQPVRPQ